MTEIPDFDAVYRGHALAAGIEQVPWNIGVPQPAIAEIIERGGVRSPVLDAGCGVGVTTLHLASLGYQVLGVDASEAAIAQAQAGLGTQQASFQVADITEFSGYDGHFGTVIDSALFHSFPVESRSGYVSSIARAAQDGAALYILVFDHGAFPPGMGPATVAADELRDAVSEHWTVDSIESSTIRALLPTGFGDQFPLDEAGRRCLPAHLLTGHR